MKYNFGEIILPIKIILNIEHLVWKLSFRLYESTLNE